MTDLDKLIEAVEANKAVPLSFICLSPEEHRQAFRAYNGSLDAAKALHEALLPDVRWYVGADQEGWPDEFGAIIFSPKGVIARAKTPARAWLLAALHAHRSRVQS